MDTKLMSDFTMKKADAVIHCTQSITIVLIQILVSTFIYLMNRKTLHAPLFPGTNHDVLANFQHLIELYNVEAGHLIKMAYHLTKKVLFLTNVERSNTQLANAALHESTIAGLEHFADITVIPTSSTQPSFSVTFDVGLASSMSRILTFLPNWMIQTENP